MVPRRASLAVVVLAGCTFGGAATGNGNGGEDTTGTTETTLPTGANTSAIPMDDTADSPSVGGSETATTAGTTAGPDDEGNDDAPDTGSSDGPPRPFCGDGNRDPEEECDDGNRDDADGCTNACFVSGSQVWAINVNGNPEAGEFVNSVLYHPDEDAYYAVGFMAPNGGDDPDSFRMQVAPDGTVEHEAVLTDPGFESDRGIALAPDGTLAIAKVSGEVERVATDWAVTDSITLTGSGGEDVYTRAIDFDADGRAMVVGLVDTSPDDGLAALINAAFDDYERNVPLVPSTTDFYRDVVWNGSEAAFFATYNQVGDDTPGHVYRYASGFGTQGDIVVDDPLDATLREVAVNDDAIFVGGYTAAGEPSVFTAHVWAYELDLSLRWHIEFSGAAGGEDDETAFVVGVAVDPAGDVIVGGGMNAAFDDGLISRPFVRKLDAADGSERWTTIVEVEDHPRGVLRSMAIGPDNRIVAVGGVSEIGAQLQPLLVMLNP